MIRFDNIFMDNIFFYTYLLVLFFIVEHLYLRIAKGLKIEAVPNHRSAHIQNTIVGGGIIVPLASLFYNFSSGFQYPYFIIGTLIVAFISFTDDIREVSVKLRLLVQGIAIFILFFQFDVYSYNVFLVIAIAAIFIVSINAYNFLDGINGMLSANSLVHLSCLYYINQYEVHFIDEELLVTIGLAILIFSYFNFRKKAICFAGDVGSISIAFIVCGCILKLIMQTNNFMFINLLLVYYLDAVSTFIFRWVQGHNVFKAHNKHFYSFLTNDLKWPHLIVASLYAIVQLLITLLIITAFNITGNETNLYNIAPTVLIILLTGILVVFMRIRLEGNYIYKRTPMNPADQNINKNLNVSQ